MPALPHRPRGWVSVGLAAAAVMFGVTVGCSPAPSGTSPTPGATVGTSDSRSTSPAASTTGSSTAGPTTGATPSSTPSAATSAVASCRTSALRIRFADDEGGGAAGSVYGTITFTNTSKLTCSLRGFPGVSYVGKGNGTQIGAAADHDDDTAGRVTLAPKKKAVATLRRTNAGNYASECHSRKVDGLRIYPPSSRTAAFVKFHTTGCSKKSVHLLSVSAVSPG